jgi:uncharacterized protein
VNADLRILIALQDLDQKIATFHRQIVEIPNRVQALQSELQRLRQGHQDRIARSQELAKRRRASEGEVELMRSKLSRLKDQLMAVKTNKEYTAMLREIQMAEDKIRAEEDKTLDVMEQGELLDQEIKQADKEVVARSNELEQTIRELETSIPRMESEVAEFQAERALIADRVASELLQRYRKIAAARKGIALAEARDELCSACHVRIRPQVYAELRRSDSIFHCDSCDRILFMREIV